MGSIGALSLDIQNRRLKQLLSAGFSISKSAKIMGISYEKANAIARRIQQ